MNDNVNHPSHYTQGRVEVIDFIEDQQLDPYRANLVKYILRERYKNGLEDLQKGEWYLNYQLNHFSTFAPRLPLGKVDVEEFIEDQKLSPEMGDVLRLACVPMPKCPKLVRVLDKVAPWIVMWKRKRVMESRLCDAQYFLHQHIYNLKMQEWLSEDEENANN